MKNTSLKLSNNLDIIQLNLYRFLSETLDSLNFPYFIVGARARDLILEGVHNIGSQRATLDTDLAIMFEDSFERATVLLTAMRMEIA